MQENQQHDNYEIKITDEDKEITNNTEEQQVESDTGNNEATTSSEEAGPAENQVVDQLQRLKAEFANYKKRVDRERLELSKIFKSELIISLLPAIDDFERFFNHAHSAEEDLVKGMQLIYQKLMDNLKIQGLKTINTVGEEFDPAIHEALSVEEVDGEEDDMVSEEWRKGYVFNDKLIRPAQVKVKKSVKRNDD